MSPKLPEPIFRPSRYFFPTRNSMVASGGPRRTAAAPRFLPGWRNEPRCVRRVSGLVSSASPGPPRPVCDAAQGPAGASCVGAHRRLGWVGRGTAPWRSSCRRCCAPPSKNTSGRAPEACSIAGSFGGFLSHGCSSLPTIRRYATRIAWLRARGIHHHVSATCRRGKSSGLGITPGITWDYLHTPSVARNN